MDDPQKKARDADRDAAIEVVEAAYADGQITQADYELRVERMLRAVTIGEVQSLIRDLQVPVGMPVPQPPSQSADDNEVSRLASLAPQPPTAKIIGIVAAIIGVVVAVGMAGTLSFVGSEGGSGTGFGRIVEERAAVPDLTGKRGWNLLVSEVEKKTGSTVVWSATVYPGYAVVEVPVDGQSQRSYGWYFDGSWSEWTGKGSQPYGVRRDLADIDGATVASVMKRAKQYIEDPSATYVIVDGRGRDEETCFSAYVSNEFTETAYVDAACDGTEIHTYQ